MSRRKSIFSAGPEPLASLKQQEDLSNEIDQNLRTLALLHPFSEAAKQLLVKGAFLKPNKPAFQHVIHYLVVIISAVEFRKRFRWPVISSSDESVFRSTALTYINECHSQFKWNFGPFKMQVVLFPGGNEFMKIIIELTKIAMHVVLKENDGLHLINSRGITLREAQARLQAAEEAFEQLEQFRSKVQSLSIPLKEKTQRLKELLHRVLANTAISEELVDSTFLSTWELNQLKIIDNKIMPALDEFEGFILKCESLNKLLVSTKPHGIQFDKEQMNALGLLKQSQHFDPQIDYDKLLDWFKNVMPELISAAYYKPPWSMSKLQRESQILNQFILRSDDLLFRVDAIALDTLPMCMPRKTKASTGTLISYLNEKLMVTPTIKCDTKKKHRITIWEAIPTVDSPAKIIQPSALTLEADSINAFDLGDITLMRPISTKLDPLSMLNTAMQRKGYSKSKGSPLRNYSSISPARLSNNNLPAFNSTMISKERTTQIASPNRIGLSPLRKSLF